ncbi:MAG: hypothetical protein HYT61_03385 [Candidatus Yanofskybacteria bacterium]|nr:hypothetical protein [Candidatus Yanofskybacteria bacterium]
MVFLIPDFVSAEISIGASLSSDNFRILDSQHSIFGGTASSSSSSFILRATVGDLAIGSSSITNFGLRSGFLYFPKVTAPILHTALKGNAEAFLSWTPASASQGFSVGGYNVCTKLTSGGTYSCQNVGNVIFYQKSSLTNNSDYTFKIETKDGVGNVVATSNEKSVTPVSSSIAEAANASTFNVATRNALTLTNSGGTTAVLDFPQNFYTQTVQLVANSFPNSYFASSKPAPSQKNFVGKTYDFNIFHPSTGDQISAISIPATITLSYSSSDVSGITESSLAPYRWGSSDSSWQLVSGATINTTNKTITFSTANFSSFAIFGTTAATPTPTPASSGGGGGGGGGSILATAAVEFGGFAYPSAVINFLKDGSNAGATTADSSGKFSFILSGLSAGGYNFGFWAQDKTGRRSVTFTKREILTSGSIAKVSNIVLPPTISLNKTSVNLGEQLTVSGSSVPDSQVRVSVVSEPKDYITKSLLNGDYSQVFSTIGLEKGIHTVKTKTEVLKTGDESIFSQLVTFGIGVAVPQKECSRDADINSDGKINLIDFSIMAYWWKRTVPEGSNVDLNCDGLLNLADFSILAFHWSG